MSELSYIPLNRQFRLVPANTEEDEFQQSTTLFGAAALKSWEDLDSERLCVILAEAGAGKTAEMRQRAALLRSHKKAAFFLPIESIAASLDEVFEIGTKDDFDGWIHSTSDAWFYLDSVDEARLEHPRNFATALRNFERCIRVAIDRAHVYISSRPAAWRSVEDGRLLRDLFPKLVAHAKNTKDGESNTPEEKGPTIAWLPVKSDRGLFDLSPKPRPYEDKAKDAESGTRQEKGPPLYILEPLEIERIRTFAIARRTDDIELLLSAISRANLLSLASRPFDLEFILNKWNTDKAIGSRKEMLLQNIKRQLSEDHNSNRVVREQLNTEDKQDGVQRLAAAVMLTGISGINVPEKLPLKAGIDATVVLSEWPPNAVYTLLQYAVFNDVMYGAVRFRHRELTELLAAQWILNLLNGANSRSTIERLFFQEKYGQSVVTQRLRALLPWLILADDRIRDRVLTLRPEIALEGGDPGRLPASVRKTFLSAIVERIACRVDDRQFNNSSAYASFASGLGQEAMVLIDKYFDDDPVLNFLGDLAMDGQLSDCAAQFCKVALTATRSLSIRKRAVRVVAKCASSEEKHELLHEASKTWAVVEHELLTELIPLVEPNIESIELLKTVLNKLPPIQPPRPYELDYAFRNLVRRFAGHIDSPVYSQFIDALCYFLQKPRCNAFLYTSISEQYSWLLTAAVQAVEHLVRSKQKNALQSTSLSILHMAACAANRIHSAVPDSIAELRSLVPEWTALNDALYWDSIQLHRARKLERNSESVTTDFAIANGSQLWRFDASALDRLLGYTRSRLHLDDQLVALNRAIRIYLDGGCLPAVLMQIQDSITGKAALEERLALVLSPVVTKEAARLESRVTAHDQWISRRLERDRRARDRWIEGLKSADSGIRYRRLNSPTEFHTDIFNLFLELMKNGHNESAANWQALGPEFGDVVAREYREAAVSHWRTFTPPLRSEGEQFGTVNDFEMEFALAGLSILASESPDFPRNFSEPEIRHILKYVFVKRYGFPFWLERIYRHVPDLVTEVVRYEIVWELENAARESDRFVLRNVANYAAWIHKSIAPWLFDWAQTHSDDINPFRRECTRMLFNGGVDFRELATLASTLIDSPIEISDQSWWFATLIVCSPDDGVRRYKSWLSKLNSAEATMSVETFLIVLFGDRGGDEQIGRFVPHWKAEHLKNLYIIAHHYLRLQEDTVRPDGKSFRPERRDDAQFARDRILKLLTEPPGKEFHTALKQLTFEHPAIDRQPMMGKYAQLRADIDGDLELWQAEQVYEFHSSQTITPSTHRQLFDLVLQRLEDLKDELEQGNDSVAQTWQRAQDETEMRRLIANRLRMLSSQKYTIASENELANGQRTDISIHCSQVPAPVPIELKLLDKDWSGKKLCESLRDQLAGDYMREKDASHGVFLLVAKEVREDRKWKFVDNNIYLPELAKTLEDYWSSISAEYPDIETIRVIVIDLSLRSKKNHA